MGKQNIFPGSSPNDGTGDTLYQGALKINNNFNEIYTTFGDGTNLYNVTGPQGAQGFQGPQGAQGVAGPQGAQGFQGPQGAQGSQGSAGAQGSTGAQGDQGAQGFQGTAGINGPQGAQGFQGTAGINGPQGIIGPQGAQGGLGINGPQGAQGAQGGSGINGPQGPQGAQGDQGAQGFQGAIGIPGSRLYSVTNNGSSDYVIDGSNDPTLNLLRGFTYTFSISAFGHPFWIKTAQVTGTGSAYSNGVTNNGTENGTIIFAVPYDAPNTLYYICQNHSGMSGTISITNVGPQGAQGAQGAQGPAGIGSGSSGIGTQWITTAAGIHTLSNVGIGTTNLTSALTVKGNTSLETLNVSGVSTFTANVDFYDGYGLAAEWHSGKSALIFESGKTLRFGGEQLHIYGTTNSEGVIVAYESKPINFKTSSGAWNSGQPTTTRLSITGAGVTVTGTTVTDQLNVSGISTFSNTVNFNTNTVNFGTQCSISTSGNDLNINAYNDVYIRGTYGGTKILSQPGANLVFVDAVVGDVSLYYQTGAGSGGSSKRLQTLGTGVTVTGTTFTNQLNVSGVSTSQGGFTSGIGVTNPVQITVIGNTLTFTVVGIGSTSLTLV